MKVLFCSLVTGTKRGRTELDELVSCAAWVIAVYIFKNMDLYSSTDTSVELVRAPFQVYLLDRPRLSNVLFLIQRSYMRSTSNSGLTGGNTCLKK